MDRTLLLQNPAIQELFQTFSLHGDHVHAKLWTWLERWMSVGAVQAELTGDQIPKSEAEQDNLLNGLFGELAQKFLRQKCSAVAQQVDPERVDFRLVVLAVNRTPVNSLRPILNG